MPDNDIAINDKLEASDFNNETISKAKERFSADEFQNTIDLCGNLVSLESSADNNPVILEAYYLWCLACLKLGDLGGVLTVCNKARSRFGEYLDSAYFELIAASANGTVIDVPHLAEQYMNLWSQVEKGADPHKNRTFSLAGHVLLIWGQALEQLNSPCEALDIYKKYLLFHPDDKEIADRIIAMESPIVK